MRPDSGKIVRLPGAKTGTDPVLFLAQLLETARAGGIKSIACSIQWQDGTFDDAHVEMDSALLLYHAHILMDKAHKEVIG